MTLTDKERLARIMDPSWGPLDGDKAWLLDKLEAAEAELAILKSVAAGDREQYADLRDERDKLVQRVKRLEGALLEMLDRAGDEICGRCKRARAVLEEGKK